MEPTRLAGPPAEGRDPGRRDEGRCHSSGNRRRMNVHSLGETRVVFTIFYFILGYSLQFFFFFFNFRGKLGFERVECGAALGHPCKNVQLEAEGQGWRGSAVRGQ